MDQQTQEWKKQKDGIEQLFDVLGFLYKWGNDNPVEAQSFAMELRQMTMRYLLEPDMESITLQIPLPLDTFSRYLQCYDADRMDHILLRGVEEVIEKHKKKDGE